jgi:hypothetical protein
MIEETEKKGVVFFSPEQCRVVPSIVEFAMHHQGTLILNCPGCLRYPP